jgi:hypothetical protein
MQERGTKATIVGNKLTLAFNPSVGFARSASTFGGCVLPPNLTRVSYGNLQNVLLRPVGDPSRKQSLSELLAGQGRPGSSSSTQLACGSAQSSF